MKVACFQLYLQCFMAQIMVGFSNKKITLV